MATVATTTANPRVVIIGAGFGGLAAARALKHAPVELTIIDRRNFHLFQPLLYQVATASLSPADIAAPIRSVLRDQANARVVLDKVVDVDRHARRVVTENGRNVPFDYLVVATGARHSYFGRDDWASAAPGIKTVDDATRVRAKVLKALEEAELEDDDVLRKALLTFVIVGGGPTGVEMAGAIAELVRHAADRDFRRITPESTSIVLVEAGARILPGFREELSRAAHAALEAMGVAIATGSAVTDVSEDGVRLGATRLAARTVIWAAGVKASPAGRWLDARVDRAGRVAVEADFSLPDDDAIFVIGDTAAHAGSDGAMLPGTAPAAKQAGRWVGGLIEARVLAAPDPAPFRYRDAGSMATIGRKFAIVDLGWLRLTGFSAWLFWSAVHVWSLIGFRSRLSVATSWLWSYLTYERGARLITGREIALVRPATEAPEQKDAA
ncbi:Type II NADH:quinone oxidoreductase Ndh [Hyphomicrobiales bacterium]|nr:Type II NADH:quinone oxidoreductase Ndh [Hyphomicrobiales bacterium]CAH1699275.1 NADH dehydrogenase [Hyphomicrobiales bacterium]CAI0343062.1 Type II NADH:quinone oxidoreductase Ndh [Hyphomicrobiales bacterium]